ncbi:RES domain-containing protein [Aliiroseovarius halocynthiae]|uniref:RES domain-containing protein n=1 Tax=Aliiroseovarius halocynthiae TaxID=985055 RepID=A0A545SM47_9RHOB|nr:RES family NAD+ phosphorylase [Aliiroseovarius halocynthiae]TQV66049.1 RES domain-containing protein [Aliiroseovarius halocynthiae]SMR83243.1 RES domain-containing protein [Aliiroseovarius halocynthiae]
MTDLLSVTLNGLFWRSTFLGHEDRILAPASAPFGRWHTEGQKALYLSGTPEGCRVALNVYLRKDDPERGIYPLRVINAQVADLRDPETRAAYSAPLDEIHARWADLRAEGLNSPTWRVSDRARAAGLDGILTPSRSRPDLTHLTLFQWNSAGAAQVAQAGAPLPFHNES